MEDFLFDFIDQNILSVTSFEILNVQFWWPWTNTIRGHPRSKVIVPIGRSLVVSYMTSIVSNIVGYFSRYSRYSTEWPFMCWCTVKHSRYLTWKFCDLDLGQFKVIQGQRWWCQSTAHGWLSIRLLLTPTSYLSPFLKYLKCNFNDLELRHQHAWCIGQMHVP